MTRAFSWLAIVLAMGLVACGDDDSMATPDAGGDADMMMPDAGTDTGEPPRDAGTDTGPVGCTEGCAIVEIVGGADHSCARRENGEVLCWGGNFFGQLGDDGRRHGDCSAGGAMGLDCSEIPRVVLGVEATALRANGGPNACAVTASGPQCWGRSVVPPVGSDQPVPRFRPEAEPAAAGADDLQLTTQNLCILTSGMASCLGDNAARQVADNDTEKFSTMQPVDFEGVLQVAVSMSGLFQCARSDSEVRCWGSNQNGQLGDGSSTHTECGVEMRNIDCSGTLVNVAGDLDPSTVTDLQLGGRHSCALTSAGTVWCWGDNSAGQLGLLPTGAGPNVPTEITAAGSDIAALGAGGDHTCVVENDGDVFCWGSNEEGQLGDGEDVGSHDACRGDTIDCSAMPVQVVLPGPAQMVAPAQQHTCALLVDGDVYCWGWNDRRQLGQIDRERRTTPVKIEGLD